MPPFSAISISFPSFTARFARAAMASTATAGLEEPARLIKGDMPPTAEIFSLLLAFTPRLASACEARRKER